MLKKVLMVAFCFPPMQFIGAQRPYGLAKYLPRYGWDPIVLTIKQPGDFPPGINVLPTNYTDIIASLRKLGKLNPAKGDHQQMGMQLTKKNNSDSWKSKTVKILRQLLEFPDHGAGWYRHAVNSASELIEKEVVDAIISTSSPSTSHLIAKKLKQMYGIPWIADLRDLWTLNHYYNKLGAIRFLERRLELKTLLYADALVTVSQPLANVLGSLHKDKDIHCVTNGFDPDDFTWNPSGLSEKFTITHTGTLYNGKRNPAMLLETTARLIKENKINRHLVEIIFYGPEEEWIMHDINKYGLRDVVKVGGLIPRQEAIKKQRESQLLLLLLWNDVREKGVYTGKLFEYLGSRRPILAIGRSNSIVKDLLTDTGAGSFASDDKELEKIILNHYREFISRGEVSYGANGRIEDYSYVTLAGKYSRILDSYARASAFKFF